ncbi:hypothetical protein AAVH_15416 [Aphelenchoides avenae]|nr:hypothetical protein AAVH_15416 [Aphelenchus avenae]
MSTYIREFLKLKIEASGWPVDIKSDDDKKCFIQTNRERYEIDIDPSAMIKNPVKRSLAKLCLNSFMEAVIKAGGIACYNDTDSIILGYKSTEKCPIEAGPFLGDMSDEYANHRILAFYSGGAKQYSLMLQPYDDPTKREYVTKLRGISLNYQAAKLIHFDAMKDQVLNYGRAAPISVDTCNFVLSKTGTIHTVHSQKDYLASNQKAIIDPVDFSMRPFGYRPP